MPGDSQRIALYRSWGMTPRMARKKARIVRAYCRAKDRDDRRAINKWMHANTRFDVTNVNGPWSQRGAADAGR
jgi:hypothetical protein